MNFQDRSQFNNSKNLEAINRLKIAKMGFAKSGVWVPYEVLNRFQSSDNARPNLATSVETMQNEIKYISLILS